MVYTSTSERLVDSLNAEVISISQDIPLLLLQRRPESNMLMIVGTLLILHSAYSCLHYRELLRDLEESGSISDHPLPPTDVWVEVIAGALIILLSELTRNGSTLQPVTSKGGLKRQSMVAPTYRTREFDVYTTRAKAIY